MNRDFRKRLVVIGGGPAGLSAASKAKRERPNLEVIVFDKSNFISISKCGIPYLFYKNLKPEDLIRYTPEYFEKERDIRIETGQEVISIERSTGSIITHSVKTKSEDKFRYDELILSTGSKAILPNIRNLINKTNLFSIRSIEDTSSCLKFIESQKPQSAIIIGCGLYGLELASALISLGIKTTILESRENPFEEYAPEIGGKIIDEIRRSGIVLETAIRITDVKGGEKIEQLLTDYGTYSADLYFLAAGVEPNSRLASDTGLDLNSEGAVIADKFRRTSEFNILAAGDISTVNCCITGEDIFFPTAALANKTGYYAGLSAAGFKKPFTGTVRTVLSKYNEYKFGRVGLTPYLANLAGYEIIEETVMSSNKQHYHDEEEIILHIIVNRKNGKLLGAQAGSYYDVTSVINTLTTALHAGMDVERLANLDLSYHPSQSNVYSPIHYAARSALKNL